MNDTPIPWVTHTWNPVTGCTEISYGCANCYVKRLSARQIGRYGYPDEDPMQVTIHEDRLDDVDVNARVPRRIFVCSMSDLFHVDVPVWFTHMVLEYMREYSQHTYFLMTKRPMNMQKVLESFPYWPLPRVNIGITAEDNKWLGNRAPTLIRIPIHPTAYRFVSCEPLLGTVKIDEYLDHLGWVLAGEERGQGGRVTNDAWLRRLRNSCEAKKIPLFIPYRELDGQFYSQIPLQLDGQWFSVPYTKEQGAPRCPERPPFLKLVTQTKIEPAKPKPKPTVYRSFEEMRQAHKKGKI